MSETKTHKAQLAGFDCEVHFSDRCLKEIKVAWDGEITVIVPGNWSMVKVEEALIRHAKQVKENLEKAKKSKPLALAGIAECTFTVLID